MHGFAFASRPYYIIFRTFLLSSFLQGAGATASVGREVRIEAPATEGMLSNFDIFLTPTQEVMSESQMLQQQFSAPQFCKEINSQPFQPAHISPPNTSLKLL